MSHKIVGREMVDGRPGYVIIEEGGVRQRLALVYPKFGGDPNAIVAGAVTRLNLDVINAAPEVRPPAQVPPAQPFHLRRPDVPETLAPSRSGDSGSGILDRFRGH